MDTNLKAYLLMIFLVVIAVVGFFWWQINFKSTETPKGLGSELYQNQDTVNPAENLPAVNPLENKPEVNPLSETNPFSNIKTNPFK